MSVMRCSLGRPVEASRPLLMQPCVVAASTSNVVAGAISVPEMIATEMTDLVMIDVMTVPVPRIEGAAEDLLLAVAVAVGVATVVLSCGRMLLVRYAIKKVTMQMTIGGASRIMMMMTMRTRKCMLLHMALTRTGMVIPRLLITSPAISTTSPSAIPTEGGQGTYSIQTRYK